MYELVISRQAIKDIERLPDREVPKVVRAVEALATDPRPAGCKKLKGQLEYLWRISTGSSTASRTAFVIQWCPGMFEHE